MPKIEMSDEIASQYGRNLLEFQKLELNLKKVIGLGQITIGGSKGSEPEISTAESMVKMSTLGGLVTKYKNMFSLDAAVKDKYEYQLVITYFGNSTHAESFGAFISELESLVQIRNELVHHFLMVHFENGEGNKGLLDTLVKQFAKVQTASYRVCHHIETVKAGMLSLKENGDKILRPLSDYLLLPQPLFVLANLSVGSKDGWVALSYAGGELTLEHRQELDVLKAEHSAKTLSELLLSTGVFELVKKPNLKGHDEVFYRLSIKH
jgi:hypothetical protein